MTFRPITIEVEGEVFLTPVSDHFGFADQLFIRRTFRDRARILANQLTDLIHKVQRGDIGHRAFVRQSMAVLQKAYYVVFSLGALSVDSFHVTTPKDMEVLNAELFGERRFLQSFARDLSRGALEMAPEFRARLYLSALRGVFELGRLEALPAGPYDWILGDADHCESCTIASVNGPYKRDALSRISFPVVPGIPGSGEVCRGLTKCGCTLRLRGFPVGETLQLELRDILDSIMMEV